MIGYFVFGVCVLLALVVGSQGLANADPKKVARITKLVVGTLLVLAALFFAVTGRFVLAPPLGMAALWFFRNKPLFGSRASAGQKSSVQTNWLIAELDHDSGDMDATIKQGSYEGRKLSELNQSQLVDLLAELKLDQESVALVESYIDRKYGDEYSEGSEKPRQDDGIFSRQDALDVLELDDDAGEEEIRAAHRRLMKKFHPDHGGSAYMAAKLNEAKEFLLGK